MPAPSWCPFLVRRRDQPHARCVDWAAWVSGFENRREVGGNARSFDLLWWRAVVGPQASNKKRLGMASVGRSRTAEAGCPACPYHSAFRTRAFRSDGNTAPSGEFFGNGISPSKLISEPAFTFDLYRYDGRLTFKPGGPEAPYMLVLTRL
jgi:hypothetical protein